MEMKLKLKPCPFCGSKNVLLFGGYYNNYADHIVCTNCKAKFQTDKYLTGEKLAEAWNKRAEPEKNKHGTWLYNEIEGMFYCSECGEGVVYNVYNYCMWCGAIMDGGKK